MNVAKDYCDCIVSWEVQDNRKLSCVVQCTYSQNKQEKLSNTEATGTLYVRNHDDCEMDYQPVLLMPFLHPELTNASFCDLKIFVSPKFDTKIDRVVVISNAKVAEFFDRAGELLISVRGEKCIRKNDGKQPIKEGSGSCSTDTTRWFRKELIPHMDTFEIKVRFSEHQHPNKLLIKYIGVHIIPFNWSPDKISSHIPVITGVQSSSGTVSQPMLSSNKSAATSITSSTSFGAGLSASNNTVRSDRLMEVIGTLNSLSQILSLEFGATHKGSSPQLSSWTDSTANQKQRQTASPVKTQLSNTSEPIKPLQSNCSLNNEPTTTTTPVTIADTQVASLKSLHLWLESRLCNIEQNLTTKLDQINTRLSIMESHLPFYDNTSVSYKDATTTAKGNYHTDSNQLSDKSSSNCSTNKSVPNK